MMYSQLTVLLALLLAFSPSSNADSRRARVVIRAAVTGTQADYDKLSTNATEQGHGARHGHGRQGWWRHAHQRNGTTKGTEVQFPASSSSGASDVVQAPGNTVPIFSSTKTPEEAKPTPIVVAVSSSVDSSPVINSANVQLNAAPPSSSSVPNSESAPDEWSSGILSAHNTARASHSAPALVWSSELTAVAKTWAETCIWQHGGTGGIAGGAGQNLASGASTGLEASQSGQAVVDGWMAEEKDYNPENPAYSHYTQVVWKNTQELGCYQAKCEGAKFVKPDGSTVFKSDMKSVVYTVCNYRKPGNYAGQYGDNVVKLGA